MARVTETERRRTFGAPCTTSNLRTYLTPWGLRVQVHFLVLPRFSAACALAKRASAWVPRRIDSYNCRQVRGSTAPSLHSYGLAVDFFATEPGVVPPGGVWEPENGVPPAFAAAFERYGFFWGANFTRRDVPHIEWCDGRPAPLLSPPTIPWTWEDALPKPLDFTSAAACPTGGYWKQSAEGGIYAFGGAPYHGAYNAHPDLGGNVRYFTALVATPVGGYVQVAHDGATYQWDPK